MTEKTDLKDFLKKTCEIRELLKSRAKSVLNSHRSSRSIPLSLLKHQFEVIPQLLCRETRHLSVIHEENEGKREELPLTSSPGRGNLRVRSGFLRQKSAPKRHLPSARRHEPSKVLHRVYHPPPLDIHFFHAGKTKQRSVGQLTGGKSLVGLGPVLGPRSYRVKSLSERSFTLEKSTNDSTTQLKPTPGLGA